MFARAVEHRPLAIEHSRRQLFEDRDLDIASEFRLVLLPKLEESSHDFRNKQTEMR
jgi:hypothetical protein